MAHLADVVSLPARSAATGATTLISGVSAISSGANTIVGGVSTAMLGQLRQWSSNEVDNWGRDNAFVNRVWAISRLRWQVSVGGTRHLPKRKGALVVVNTRHLALAPIFAALAIGGRINRPVRFVGRPDTPPLGPIMQRLGGLLPLVDELEGALRAGEIVVLGAGPLLTNRGVGEIDHRLVGAAVAAGVNVFPAATASAPTHRGARVDIGPAVRIRTRRGPLRELETADLLQQRIDALLGEFGGVITGTPLDWLPIEAIGGL